MSKRILDLDVATTLSGASFVVAKDGLNEQVPAGNLLTLLGFTLNGAPLNLGMSFATGTNLTVSFKQLDGVTDPSPVNPILAAFRDVDKTKGKFNIRSLETGLSGTIPSGATLGQTNGQAADLYVYLLDVGGSLEPAFSAKDLGDSGWVTTTTLDTTSDSATGVYSASPRAEVPFIKAARLVNTQATAGTWASAPTEVWLAPFIAAETTFFKSLKNIASASAMMDGLGFSAFFKTLVDDASAGAVLTTLGVSAFAQTLLDDADASTVLSTLGFSTFVKTLIDDTTAGGVLTTLGVSAFIQTLLDDTSAATARTTLFGVSTTVDNTVPRYDGTTGALQTSGVVIDDSNNVSGVGALSAGAPTFSGNLIVNTAANPQQTIQVSGTARADWGVATSAGAFAGGAVANDVILRSRGGALILDTNTGIGTPSMSIGGGNTVVTLGVGQLKFPASQNASSDANTLDDYEEGSWTPSIAFNGGSTGITYTARQGDYCKIGKNARAHAYVILSSKGSSTGGAGCGGSPFTSGSGVSFWAGAMGFVASTSAPGTLHTLMQAAAGTGIVFYTNGGSVTSDTNFTNTTEVDFASLYTTSA